MKDIAKAYKAEQNYYADKERLHSNTLDIMNYLTPCGYDNYDDYYNDVQEYKLKIQDYDIVEEPYIDPKLHNPYILNKIPACLYQIHCNTNYAFVTNDFDKNEILQNYNYEICKLGYNFSSGPIISESGDLRIDIIYSYQIKINHEYFLNKLKQYLLNYFDNVQIDNNDLLIDNKKVCGCVSYIYNDMYIILMQINFIDKSEIIQKICGEQHKKPGYINPNILSPEQLKDEIITWLTL